MKTKHLLYLAIGALVAFGCTNEENEEIDKGDNPTISPEFTAPAGFDYATSRNVVLDVLSRVKSVVTIYADEKREHVLVEKLNVPTSSPLELNIPIANDVLYVEYPTKSGIAIKSVSLTSLNRSEIIDFTLPEDIVASTNEQDAGLTFYHNTGVAMFEDNWPNLPDPNGIDADYNDVVVEYDLKTTECNEESLLPSKGGEEGLLLTLDIRAIGGKFPTTIGVVLGDLDPKYIGNVSSQIILKSGQGVKNPIGTPGTDATPAIVSNYPYNGRTYAGEINVDIKHGAPVITLSGLGRIRNDNTFFQTTKDHITVGISTIRAEITLSGIPANVSREDVLKAYRTQITNTQNQNFFIIAHNDRDREIHLKGYKPTYAYTEKYKSDAEGYNMMEGTTYCSSKEGYEGYVWALKVPVGTKHAYERTPFAEAYPKFNNWKKTEGREDQDWYMNVNPEKVVRYW